MCVEWQSDSDEVWQSDVKPHAADDRKVKVETGSRINLFLVHVTLIIQMNGGPSVRRNLKYAIWDKRYQACISKGAPSCCCIGRTQCKVTYMYIDKS